MKKTMTMTLTSKRQTVFPLDWCRREGLERGGPLNVFDLGKDGLLIRPIKAPEQQAVAKLLKQTPVGRHSPRQAAAIVNQALRQVRDESGRH
jgi:bifunctional DNA-binding transcriptional regulator/antitoxin component of YhaV-PrlF toxin-antitoxin module